MSHSFYIDLAGIEAYFVTPINPRIVSDDSHTPIGICGNPSMNSRMDSWLPAFWFGDASKSKHISYLWSFPWIHPRFISDMKRWIHRIRKYRLGEKRLVFQPPQTEKSSKEEHENYDPPNIFLLPFIW